ncbi:MAG: hypothetical protein IJ068_00970 [Bacilli bacterium]|nr:hypothetical protein [Bacilli bacterium]
MNKVKKIKNIVITAFVLFFLTDKSYKLIKGEKIANRVIQNHVNSLHRENIVAHRGFSGMFLDNSKESIDAALESDCVDMIEIDVRFTQNQKIVLHHDSLVGFEDTIISLEDLTLEEYDSENVDYIVKNYPMYNFLDLIYEDQLFFYKRFLNKTVSLGEEKLIFLSDIIRDYSFKKPLIIDVKTNFANLDFMKELDRLLNSYKDFVYIQSNCFQFLNTMVELYPDYNYLYIINSSSNIKNKNNEFRGYTVKYSLLNKIKIEQDKIYLIYTINSNQKYLNLINNNNYNNDMYIITDNPDYICALSDSKKLRK